LSEPNDATFIAFETVVAAAFERVAGRLNAAGYELTEASDADVAAGRVGRVAHTPAPWGVRVELVQDLENAPMPFPSPLAPGGFLTDRIGFYLASPAGFAVEVGDGAWTIGEDADDSRRHDRVSAWGHQPPRPQETATPPP
jgi:hypothetical protein